MEDDNKFSNKYSQNYKLLFEFKFHLNKWTRQPKQDLM